MNRFGVRRFTARLDRCLLVAGLSATRVVLRAKAGVRAEAYGIAASEGGC